MLTLLLLALHSQVPMASDGVEPVSCIRYQLPNAFSRARHESSVRSRKGRDCVRLVCGPGTIPSSPMSRISRWIRFRLITTPARFRFVVMLRVPKNGSMSSERDVFGSGKTSSPSTIEWSATSFGYFTFLQAPPVSSSRSVFCEAVRASHSAFAHSTCAGFAFDSSRSSDVKSRP